MSFSPRKRRVRSLSSRSMRHIDMTVDNTEGSVVRLLQAFFGVSKGFYSIKKTEDGITNTVLHCRRQARAELSPHPDDLLIRVYGELTENIIDRDRELEHHTMLSEADLAAPVYGSFTNGYVYGYIDGLSCTPATMAQHATLIAKQLAVFHKAVPVLDAAPTCFASIRRWLELWPETMADEARQQLFATINKEHVLAWLQTFEAQHSEADQLAFCHNDLLCGNIVYNPDDDAVAFIDYEYSDANPAAFDIANHFNEHCGVAEVDFSAYPDGTFRRDFVSTYLSQKLDEEPTAEAIETLLERVEFYRKVSHLFWGVWAVLQAVYSSIEFDYVKYAKRRLDELTRLDATS
eukprot:TRINITY_DN8998_c0_g1_i1.p1 TRINITY_DN8998_c0_g1~~TRINITY_DN8998_c0_g1_i1.p1  ORF type:complete len:348 (+),score=68.45 TRINITY_DN8998_c0_g1_i1:273-1316(+)